MKALFKFNLAVIINLLDVVHYLKFKQVFYLLSKLHDKCYTGVAIGIPLYDTNDPMI